MCAYGGGGWGVGGRYNCPFMEGEGGGGGRCHVFSPTPFLGIYFLIKSISVILPHMTKPEASPPA